MLGKASGNAFRNRFANHHQPGLIHAHSTAGSARELNPFDHESILSRNGEDFTMTTVIDRYTDIR